MTLAFLVYLAAALGNLNIALVIGFVLSLLGLFICSMAYADCRNSDKKEKENGWSWVKRCFYLSLICGFLMVFVPSQKTMYVMVGAYAAQKIYESPEAARISSKVIAIVDKKLDEYLTEEVKDKK